ncbi:helix-turn-helix domain-containing protein [Caulobacter sp. FWC2]|uniref:helix-turn-helix domain-containing protein n=1 Tax=Caulobacter sp. FWC2 TaxID=69664 RepID=UPI000C14563F|nr:transcriptional regulator [Caulobacter sp. FWC2]
MRRRVLGLSQTVLANAVGLTFQQLQKYERGHNRISASKLYGLALRLQSPVSWFFEGLPSTDAEEVSGAMRQAEEQAHALQAFLLSPEGLEFATLLPRTSKSARSQLLNLVRAMAGEDDAPR